MSRLPEACDLLLTARATLLDRLLPALPEDLHYDARMIANTLAIASRESTQHAAVNLQAERCLAAAIRAGEHDRGTAWEALLTLTRNKLAVSNPRLLQSYLELLGDCSA